MIKNRLKEIIDERNINVSKMADSIGISRNSFYGLYKDNQSFKNETWTKISNYLHLTINDLIYSVSEEVQITLVKELSTDKFPKKDGLYVGNYLLNFFNYEYSININVPVSYKLFSSDEFVSIYYDYSNTSFLDKDFLDTIMKNDKNRYNLFVFIYENFVQDIYQSILPFVFINSINGSFIDFYALNSNNENCDVFYHNKNYYVEDNSSKFRMISYDKNSYEAFWSSEVLESILDKD